MIGRMSFTGLAIGNKAILFLVRNKSLCCLLRRLLRALYQCQTQEVFVRRIPLQPALLARAEAAEQRGATCLWMESLDALHKIEAEFPSSVRDSVDQLRRRVAQGCVVIVVWRPKPSGSGPEVLGY